MLYSSEHVLQDMYGPEAKELSVFRTSALIGDARAAKLAYADDDDETEQLTVIRVTFTLFTMKLFEFLLIL